MPVLEEVFNISRSYKHNPVYTDGHAGSTKESKRFANKKVRHTDFDELPRKGNGYKKVFESYDIHDYISYYTKQQWIDHYEKRRKEYENGVGLYCFGVKLQNDETEILEDSLKDWEKSYRRK